MIIETSKDDDTAELNLTKQFVTYNGRAKFKIKRWPEAHLVFYTTDDIKTKMKQIFSFKMKNEMLKYVLKYKGITGEKDPKIYIYLQEDWFLFAKSCKQNEKGTRCKSWTVPAAVISIVF